MQPTEDFKLAYHSTLQELVNHYNSINWNMHSIFIVLHSGLIGALAFALLPPDGTLWKGDWGALIVILGTIAGAALADGWQKMFNRHRLFTKAFYKRIRELEAEIKNGDGELGGLKIHRLLGPVISESRANGAPGHVATSDVINNLQNWALGTYCIIWAIAVVRTLGRLFGWF